jgi:hypothetical protein
VRTVLPRLRPAQPLAARGLLVWAAQVGVLLGVLYYLLVRFIKAASRD